jgi:hypothetical protein
MCTYVIVKRERYTVVPVRYLVKKLSRYRPEQAHGDPVG